MGNETLILRNMTDCVVEGTEDDQQCATFVFSDQSVDRYNDTVAVNGWHLDHYRKNPIILFGHDSGSIDSVIGRAKNVRIENDKLLGTVEFASAEVSATAEQVRRLVKAGILRAGSVGFVPLKYKKSDERRGGIDFVEQELLEYSIVPVPALPSALIQNGATRSDAIEHLRSVLWADEIGALRATRKEILPEHIVRLVHESVRAAVQEYVQSLNGRESDRNNVVSDPVSEVERRRQRAAQYRRELRT